MSDQGVRAQMYRVHFEEIHPGVWDIGAAPNHTGAHPHAQTLLVTVGLHPDEAGQCFNTLLHLVRSLLIRGRVLLVDCFPAHLFPDEAGRKRFVGPEQRDPNRSFLPEVLEEGSDPLRHRLRLIADLVGRADVVLDLHRYTKADGGPVAFPFDEHGIDLAIAADIPMIVTDLVSAVEGALSLFAARQGKLPLVVEVGSREYERASDRSAISTLLSIMRALKMVSEADHVAPASAWPEGPKVFRLYRTMARAELSEEVLDQIAALGHMAPLPALLAEETGLPADARLLMVNPKADPAAYACVPAFVAR